MIEQHVSAGIVPYVYNPHTNKFEYLVLKYVDGHWDFPKGHIEPGETLEVTALRELREETGITAELDTTFTYTYEYDFTTRQGTRAHKKVYWFTGRASSKHIMLSHEHTDYTWLNYEECIAQLTYDTAKKLIRQTHTHLRMPHD